MRKPLAGKLLFVQSFMLCATLLVVSEAGAAEKVYIPPFESDFSWSDKDIFSGDPDRIALTSCYQVEYPLPLEPLREEDFVEWLVLDDWKTCHMTGTHDIFTALWADKVYCSKDKIDQGGINWDINLYDESFVYGWITEFRGPNGNEWLPRFFKKSFLDKNIVMGPRSIRLGYPGTRIMSCDSRYQFFRDCVGAQNINQLRNVIHEIWGPYQVQMRGNIGIQEIIKDAYFWDCEGNTTATCNNVEINWYSKRYGWVRWSGYHNENGTFVFDQESIFNVHVDGAASPYFPCF